ncbi:MAG: laccase domain-containing protein [Bacilli bacterium]|nr:laccase domain-containing protein [Bacilli bacterium]
MKLNIFHSVITDGIMSKEKNYFKNVSKEDIEAMYYLKTKRFLQKYNLSNEDMVVLNEKNNKMSSRVVTKNQKEYKEAVLILKETTPNLPILVETDDDPVIVASAETEDNKKVAVIGLATIGNLANGLIHEMTETLMKETDKATFEMTFYIGPCPSKENYVVEKDKVTAKIFEKAIETKKNITYLDIRYAIFNELYLEIVDPNNIYFDSTDTVTSEKYFSRIGNKEGRHAACIVFTNEEA